VLNLLLMALMIARARESQRGRGAALSCRIAAAGGGDPGCYRPHLALYRRHSETLRGGERFVATGYGALVGVAKEFETKFTETVRVPSSGFELEAYMHGPYLEANARHVMLFIEDAPDARTRALRTIWRRPLPGPLR
jgi:glucoselysine-6-phosphate deglycase